ncbi:MAG: MBL fold metallo-hydrolase [Gammaproteobacteria bacterium]|jgi:glyoxylase-like metal-dependent hydrolase (beta-lactamase superfamily II)
MPALPVRSGRVCGSAAALALALAGTFSAERASAQDFADARIETQQLGEGLYVLFGVGEGVIAGNMLVSIGSDGTLVVDSQFPEMVPKYSRTIADLGGGEIEIVINTHWHFDHADGNKVLGPRGATIIAHDNARRMLMHDNVINLVTQTIEQPRFDDDAQPALSYGSRMNVHFNGEPIRLMHAGPAHTLGDTAVIFSSHNVVHLGDVFNTSGYPFIDADNGGSLNGIIDFCAAVLEVVPRTAIVVPGHGPVSDYQGLRDYVAMLSEIRDRLSALISSGATLEQVVAAQITAEWDASNGDPTMLLDRAYASMLGGRD